MDWNTLWPRLITGEAGYWTPAKFPSPDTIASIFAWWHPVFFIVADGMPHRLPPHDGGLALDAHDNKICKFLYSHQNCSIRFGETSGPG